MSDPVNTVPRTDPALLLTELRGRLPAMLEALDALVSTESPSSDPEATQRCAGLVAELGGRLLGVGPDRIVVDGRTHLRWSFGSPRVLLLGHLDTVWSLGTLDRWPFEVDGATATGPGVFDMKAGLVQGLFALSVLDEIDGVAVLVTSDEELGSPTSRTLVEDTARGLDAALVLEPSAAGALKTGRKGASMYELTVHGTAAHAGLEPERGANALVELARQVTAISDLARPELGTTVTPVTADAGTAANVVPARASFRIDVRAATRDEQERVHQQVRALRPADPRTRLAVRGGPNRPPLQRDASGDLFRRARRLADGLGIGPVDGTTVGGASDGNLTAGIGVPTLDGLGAVGDGAHAEGEHVVVGALAERAALVAGLVGELLDRPAGPR